MATNFYIKQNDTAPAIEAVLTNAAGRSKSMINASVVRFSMSTENGTQILNRETGYVSNGTKGIVGYQWAAGDTSTVGVHNAEFEIEYNNGQIETFPNSGYIKVIIRAELA